MQATETRVRKSKNINKELVISVKEARKLLGKQFNYLSDDEVIRIVALLDNIARGFIQSKVPQV